ncbi:lipopolysaccharide biosynthesis protein [Bacteroidia bacterium]|nr:lipopolysaccharide biosynthesis protein [Bacteroidia bacterium]
MAEATLKQKTAKGLFWGGISSGAQQLLGLVFGIYLARKLNDDDYGLIAMLAIFTGVASTITIQSGFSTALTNKKDATHEDYNAVFWFMVFAGLLVYTILFFAAPLIAHYYQRPELVDLTRVMCLGIFIGGIGTVPYTVMFKQMMVKQLSIITIISVFISGGVGVILAMNGFTYWSLALQYVTLFSLSAILLCFISPWKPTFHIDFRPIKKLFPFSIKLFITNVFAQINGNFLSVLLGKLYNGKVLGQYSQGQKWASMGQQFIGGTINSVAQPVLVKVNEEKERQLNTFRKMIRFGAFISFPLMLGLAFVSKEFILITIGEKWLPSVPFLQLFCLWGAFAYLGSLYTNLIFTHGKSNVYMYGTIAVGLLQLIIVLSMYKLGIFSMVIAYLSINFLGLLFWQYYTCRLIGLRIRNVLKDILPFLIITIACLFVSWLLTKNILNLYALIISKIVTVGLLYLFVLKISNVVIFKESIEFLTNSIKQRK